MNEVQRIECTALNSKVYALRLIIYSVEKLLRQEGYDSFHKMVQFNIDEEHENRFSDYDYCITTLRAILAKLDYRKAWGKVVGTNGLVLIEDGVIIGLGMDSALRTTSLPYTHANVAITPPGCREYLPVGLQNIDPVYPDPNKPFTPFEKPDGRLPKEIAAATLDIDPKSRSEILVFATLVMTAASVLSQADRVLFFDEIERLRESS